MDRRRKFIWIDSMCQWQTLYTINLPAQAQNTTYVLLATS